MTDWKPILSYAEIDELYEIELRAENLKNARLFADRKDMISYFSPRLRNGTIAEIGVLFGDFSRVIVDEVQPKIFDAYDLFRIENLRDLIQKVPHFAYMEKFGEALNQSHLDFYRYRFRDEIESGVVRTIVGDGARNLRDSNTMYDMIYIDADHSYESVLRDAQSSIERLKPEGMLIFNDYTLFDHITGEKYGIVPVVNQLCVNEGWQVTGFALEGTMFADIVIERG